MLTGAYPHRTGIIANEWRNPATGEAEYNTGDTAYKYIGHATKKLDGTSPKNLRVETARLMMEQSRHSTDVIARQTGFADRYRMRRAFLRAFGQPPQVIRRNARAEAAA